MSIFHSTTKTKIYKPPRSGPEPDRNHRSSKETGRPDTPMGHASRFRSSWNLADQSPVQQSPVQSRLISPRNIIQSSGPLGTWSTSLRLTSVRVAGFQNASSETLVLTAGPPRPGQAGRVSLRKAHNETFVLRVMCAKGPVRMAPGTDCACHPNPSLGVWEGRSHQE